MELIYPASIYLSMNISLSSFLQKQQRAQTKARHEYFNVFKKSKAELQQYMKLPEEKWKILDFGCGYYYPQVLFFSREGFDIQGVDIISDFYRQELSQSTNIPLGCVRRLKKRINWKIYDWSMLRIYFQCIESLSGIREKDFNYRVHSYDGTTLPFRDGEFNVIISNSVLESVKDVQNTASELRRVIQKGGVINLSWKNFYSFSGNIRSFKTNKRNPWGHLRGELNDGINLNRMRPEKVREIFSRYFKSNNLYYRDINHFIVPMETDIEFSLCTENPHLFEWEMKKTLFSNRKELLEKYPENLLLSRGFKLIGQA